MSFELDAIRVCNLSKSFFLFSRPRDRILQFFSRRRAKYSQEFVALKDVSFEVRKGETIGIIGRNGSGKSTLLQILCGTLMPTRGTVGINGRLAALLELGAGFDPELTGRENVYLGAALLGLCQEQMARRFAEVEAFADIGDFIDRPVKFYSSGMFVRLAFAVHVHTDPDVFLIDEAMAVGDHRFVQKCYRKMAEIKARGASLLFVSHDTTAVKMLCDRVIWLHEGCVRMLGDASEVVDAYRNWSDQIDQSVIAASLTHASDTSLRIAALGSELKDAEGRATSSFVHGEAVSLHLHLINRVLPSKTPVRMGFTLRNARGIDIAGTNTDVMKASLFLPEPGASIEIEVGFQLPLLAAGRYAISMSVDSADGADWTTELLMPDVIAFDVDERVKVHTLLGIDAHLTVRYPAIRGAGVVATQVT